MLFTTRTRLAAAAAATAVIASSILATAPSSADDLVGTIQLENNTYTAGSWGDGLAISGEGFTPDATVTVQVLNGMTPLGSYNVATPIGADGTLPETVFTPTGELVLPADGDDVYVTVITNLGDTSNDVILDVRAPRGITANTTTISQKDLRDEKVGLDLVVSGYAPGEAVSIYASCKDIAYSEFNITVGKFTADRHGSVSISRFTTDVACVGMLVFSSLGGISAEGMGSLIVTVEAADPADVVAPATSAPTTNPATNTTGTLPIVSA